MIGALAAVLAVAGGQDPIVEVRLAADPGRRGPAAWTSARAEAVPALAGEGLDPFGALCLRVREDGVTIEAGSAIDAAYLRGTVVLPGARWEVACDLAGVETWTPVGAVRAPDGRLGALLDALGLARGSGARTFEVGPLVAHLLAGVAHDGDSLALAALRAAADCDVLAVAATPAGALRASSGGGLLLPALLVVLADLRGRPPGAGGWNDTSPLGERTRWQLLAFTARDDARLEAALQLARLGEAADVAVLERLLWAERRTRWTALEGLLRARASGSLPEVARTRDRDHVSRALAGFALGDLWAGAPPAVRARTRTALGASAEPAAATGGLDGSRDVAFWLLLGSLVVLAAHWPTLERRARDPRADDVTSRRSSRSGPGRRSP
jgi:hypothetical protein